MVNDLGRGALVAEFMLLTAREAEMVALVMTGILNSQIAAALGTGEKTVRKGDHLSTS
jgi:DNA-binding CsgD family transcriptional regulator